MDFQKNVGDNNNAGMGGIYLIFATATIGTLFLATEPLHSDIKDYLIKAPSDSSTAPVVKR